MVCVFFSNEWESKSWTSSQSQWLSLLFLIIFTLNFIQISVDFFLNDLEQACPFREPQPVAPRTKRLHETNGGILRWNYFTILLIRAMQMNILYVQNSLYSREKWSKLHYIDPFDILNLRFTFFVGLSINRHLFYNLSIFRTQFFCTHIHTSHWSGWAHVVQCAFYCTLFYLQAAIKKNQFMIIDLFKSPVYFYLKRVKWQIGATYVEQKNLHKERKSTMFEIKCR